MSMPSLADAALGPLFRSSRMPTDRPRDGRAALPGTQKTLTPGGNPDQPVLSGSVRGFVLRHYRGGNPPAFAHRKPLLCRPGTDRTGVLPGRSSPARTHGTRPANPAPGVDERLQALLELVEVLCAQVNLVVLPTETERDGLGPVRTIDVVGDGHNRSFCHAWMIQFTGQFVKVTRCRHAIPF